MAEVTRSAVLAVVEETTSGTYQAATAASFIPLREGFSFEGAVANITSDEFIGGDIGSAKAFVTREEPAASIPKYLVASGTEGDAPEYSIVIESAIGAFTDNGTEYDTVAGSTAGTSAARAVVNVDSGEGAQFAKGQALLIKDSTNGFEVRNVYSIATDALSLNFNLSNAPGTGVNLGQAQHYSPAVPSKSYTAHLYHATSNSAFYQAMVGCRTTALNINLPANGFAEINFDFEGESFAFNGINITASNKYLDFNDGLGEENAVMTEGFYQSPHALATEIQTKMDALTLDNITVSYSDTTGKFTIASDGGTLSLLWNTGTNTANTIGTTIGFLVAADDTGATSYAADNALALEPAVTPAYDSADLIVVKDSELLIGGFNDFVCRSATEASFSISTPATRVDDLCPASGVESTLILSRVATFSATLILDQYESGLFNRFINNTTSSIMFNCGQKASSGGNWTPGTVCNIYMPNVSITGHTVTDSGGYVVVELTATGFIDNDQKDVHINFL